MIRGVPPPPTKQQDSEDLLGEAVEALLAEVGEACDRFENPPAPEDEPTLCGDGGMASAPVRASEPASDAVAETESALEAVEASAAELLEQAADELVGQLTETEDAPISDAETPTADDTPADTEAALETEPATDADAATEPEADEPEPEPVAVQQFDEAPATEPQGCAEPDAPAEMDASSETEDLLAAAADELMDLDFGGTPAPVDANQPTAEPDATAEVATDDDATDELAAEPTEVDEAIDAPVADALSADTLDAVLDGTFETPDGDVDTDAVAEDAGGFTLPEDEPEQPEAAAETAPEPEPEPAGDTAGAMMAEVVPAERPISVPEPAVGPVASADSTVHAVETAPGSGWRRVLVWAAPRAQRAARALGKVAAPAGAQGLILLSKPLAKQPAKIRDSVGWVALWTAFLAVCVWGWVLVRPSEERAPDPNASGIVSADAPATPGE